MNVLLRCPQPGALIFSGPTAVGKWEIISRVMNRFSPDAKPHLVVSWTSRLIRPGEVDGVTYHYVTPERFEQGIEDDEFLEYEKVHETAHYGTPKDQIAPHLEAGKLVFFEIDVIGHAKLRQLSRAHPILKDVPLHSIFIMPPGDSAESRLAVIERRIRGREGSESEVEILKRLSRVETEISRASEYTGVVVNHEHRLDEAVDEVCRLISGYFTPAEGAF